MQDTTLWVFGYGSLIWEPGFAYEERVKARLDGWHRSFCMRSIHHRGSVERPGLVLALDAAPDNRCEGVAFAVTPGKEASTLAGLRERELISSAYLEQIHRVRLADGRQADAICYVIDRDHVQYCGGLPLEEQARIIAASTGGRGPNRDYLWNTVAHLVTLGISDPDLEWIARRVRILTSGEA